MRGRVKCPTCGGCGEVYSRRTNPPARVSAIIRSTCTEFGVDPSDVMEYGKTRLVIQVRQEIWRRLKGMKMADGFPPSGPLIGRWFYRDASTIRHGIKMAKKRKTPTAMDLAA